MSDENLLPEERLFKAIQQEKKALAQTAKAPGGAVSKAGPMRRSLAIGQDFWKTVQEKIFKKKEKEGGEETKKSVAFPFKWQDIDSIKTFLLTGLDLTLVNRGLALMIAVLGALTVHYFVNNRPTMVRLMSSISQVRFETAPPQTLEAFQPLEYYLNQVRSRDVFNPIAAVVEKPVMVERSPEPPAPPPKPRLNEMARGIKIVGIALGETPKAMVKDDLTQEVYFLKEGDLIGNTGIAIKTILKDKVILSLGEEEMEL